MKQLACSSASLLVTYVFLEYLIPIFTRKIPPNCSKNPRGT